MADHGRASFPISLVGVCCALLCLQGVRCAYLNTFYNAKTAYVTARREHEKLLRMNPDSASELPQPIVDNYDRAIAKSLKVLEVYPKSKEWHDDAIYLMARASYYKGDVASAIRRFRRLQREFPNSPFIPESYVYLGKAYLENDNLLKAEETFLIVLEKYPYLNADEEVTLLMAQVAVKRQGKSEAIELLQKTLASVKRPEKKMEILLEIAHLYIDLHQYEKAIPVLTSAPRKKDFPEFLFRIDFSLLTCHSEIEHYEEALALADEMLKSRYYVTHYPEIRLKKARILQRAHRIDQAVDVFEQITKGVTAPEIQGEAWLELALIHQHVYGDFVKAKECFEKAVSLLADEEKRAMAQTRIEAIGELDAYRAFLRGGVAEEDTTDTAAAASRAEIDTTMPLDIARYKIGEVFWLQLEEPDSALNHFNAVTADTAVSDTLRHQALFASAWINLHMKRDSTIADSLFQLVIEECPASLFAKKAQSELGLEVTVKTREDSGHVALIKAENLYFKDGDALGAVKAYLQAARTYPDLGVGPQCMYAAAWLCDNVLHKNVTARKIYRALCDSFPQSQECIGQARPRLKVVEDTLQVLRAKKEKRQGEKGRGRKGSHGQDTAQAPDEESDEGLLEASTEADTAAALDDAAGGGGSGMEPAEAPGDVIHAAQETQSPGDAATPEPGPGNGGPAPAAVEGSAPEKEQKETEAPDDVLE